MFWMSRNQGEFQDFTAKADSPGHPTHHGSAFQAKTPPVFAKLGIERMLKMAGKFFHHVVPGVIRPLHVLWNQVIGFFFLAIAGLVVPSAIRDIRDPEGHVRLLLTIPFILILAGFGLSSFWKARKAARR